VLLVNNKQMCSLMGPEKIDALLGELPAPANATDESPSTIPRLDGPDRSSCAGSPGDNWRLADYVARGGYEALRKIPRREIPPANVIAEVKKSALRGRGGAGLPDRAQVELHAAAVQGDKYLVCNSDEGEPGTFKDRDIMRYNPHALRGMAIARVRDGLRPRLQLHARRDLGDLRALRGSASAEASKRDLRRERHPRFRLHFHLFNHHGYGAYICGEETALLESLEGKKGHAAVQAAVPGQLRSLWQADDDQQHRDIRRPSLDHAQRRRRVPQSGMPNNGGTKLFSCPATSRRPGNYESGSARRSRSSSKWRAECAMAVPQGLHSAARRCRCCPGDDHDGDRHGLRLDRQGGLDARLGRVI
jgi:hypothetical protein